MQTVSFRIDDQAKARLDRLAETRAVNPSEVLRRALDQAMNVIEFGSETQRNLDLSLADRLQLANQYEILLRLARNDDEIGRFETAIATLKSGYAIQYANLVGDFQGGLSDDQCAEVLQILDLHSIMRSVAAHSEEADRRLLTAITFPGFSSTLEPDHYRFAAYLIYEVQAFGLLLHDAQRKGLDSVTPMLPAYRRMIHLWRQVDNVYNPSINEIRQMLLVRNEG